MPEPKTTCQLKQHQQHRQRLNCCSTHSRLQRCSAHAALASLNEATFPGHNVFFHLRQDKPSASVLSWTKSQPPQELAKEIAMFLHNSWGKALTSYNLHRASTTSRRAKYILQQAPSQGLQQPLPRPSPRNQKGMVVASK